MAISKHQLLGTVLREPQRPESFQQAFLHHIDPVKGWLTEPEAFLLWSVSGAVRSSSAVVEIGSYLGRSTVAIASGVSGAPIYAVDPHTGDITEAQRGELVDTYSEFMHNIEAAGALHKITPMRMMSVSAAAQYSGPPIGFLFVDGWHSADAVEEDIRNWQPYFADEITVIFDDWQEPEVSAGITRVLSLLPPVVGSIGKDLIFTNSAEVKHLPIVKFASRYAQVRQASERMRIADDLLRAFR